MTYSTHRFLPLAGLLVMFGCVEQPVDIRGDVHWGLDAESFDFMSDEFMPAAGDPVAVCELATDGGTSFGLLDQTSGRNMLVVEIVDGEVTVRGETNGVAVVEASGGECTVDSITRDLSFGELSLSIHCDVESRVGDRKGEIDATVEARGCRTSTRLTRLGRAVGGLF